MLLYNESRSFQIYVMPDTADARKLASIVREKGQRGQKG